MLDEKKIRKEFKFRKDVCRLLPLKSLKKKFIAVREKYKNDPMKINYLKEILEELADVIVYIIMWFVTRWYKIK